MPARHKARNFAGPSTPLLVPASPLGIHAHGLPKPRC